MRRIIYLVSICMVTLIAGCQKDLPEPETKMEVEPVNYMDLSYDMPVSAYAVSQKDPFYVKHQVKGKDVLIECIVQGISFRDQSDKNKGKINLYVNGKKKEEVTAAAFMIKGLPTGTHRIKLEVVKQNNASYNLKKEFYVTIP